MFCKSCGEKNEKDAKFCVKCGTALEEKKEEVKKEDTKEQEAKNDNKVVIIILSVVGGLILLGIIGYFAITYMIGMFAVNTVKTVENGVRQEIKKSESKYGTEDQIFPEFKYTIPSALVPASYNSKTLGFFKSDSSNLCSLTIWNITYVSDTATVESIMTSHSSISNTSQLTPTNTKINGKNWTTYKTERAGTKYSEFGRFSSDGSNFYLIKYTDYKPETGVCDKYLTQFLKTVKSK